MIRSFPHDVRSWPKPRITIPLHTSAAHHYFAMVRTPQSSSDVPAPDFFERIREKSPAARTRQTTKA
ncbi:MAG: hypothetical protein KC590_04485 [Nitrospira sp.]|nr:hypothetical protein [Nitrospira sp.]